MIRYAGIDVGTTAIRLVLGDEESSRAVTLRGDLYANFDILRLVQPGRRAVGDESQVSAPLSLSAALRETDWRWGDSRGRVWSAPAVLGLFLRAAMMTAAPGVHLDGVTAAITGAADLSLSQRAALLIAARYAGFAAPRFIDPWSATATALPPLADGGAYRLADLGAGGLRVAVVRAESGGGEAQRVTHEIHIPQLGARALDLAVAAGMGRDLGLEGATPALLAHLHRAMGGDPNGGWLNLAGRQIEAPLSPATLDDLFGRALKDVDVGAMLPSGLGGLEQAAGGALTAIPSVRARLFDGVPGLAAACGQDPSHLPAQGAFALARGQSGARLSGASPWVLAMRVRGSDGASALRTLAPAGARLPLELNETVYAHRADQTTMTFDLVGHGDDPSRPDWEQRLGVRLGGPADLRAALNLKLTLSADLILTLELYDPVARTRANQSRDLLETQAVAGYQPDQMEMVAAALIGAPLGSVTS